MKPSAALMILTALVLSVTLSLTAMSSPARVLGDLDGDGALTMADMRVMLRFMVGGRTLTMDEYQLADCDGNGRVDTLDARYVLGVVAFDRTPSTLPTTTTTAAVTTTTRSPLDDDGYYDEVVKP